MLTSWLHSRRASAPEKPLRDELLSIERLEERALALAARFTIDPDPRRRARDTYPRFEDNGHYLFIRLGGYPLFTPDLLTFLDANVRDGGAR